MSILNHFARTNSTSYILYQLKKGEIDKVTEKMIKPARLCYISNSDLAKLCGNRGITASEFLEKYVCPDVPSIVSGDFGEIFSFLVVIENFANKGFVLFAPRKWRWKDDRNRAALGSDAVLFHITDDKKPSNKDFVVSIESKMKAVKSNEHRIQTAIDHAAKDKLTRLTKSINWLEEKHARNGSEVERKKIERFKDPSTHGSFQKHHKAIAIVDNTFEAEEITPALNNPNGVTALIFSIDNLKIAYENLRVKVINSI
jgi:hypothetical protein